MRLKIYPDPDITDRLSEVLLMDGANDSTWSRRLKVDRKTVLSWRHGASAPTITHVAVICDYTCVSADWLINGGERKYTHGEIMGLKI